jgi:hypothetical protein
MMAAFNGPFPFSSRDVAKMYLDDAKMFRCNWNYGNAIHDANTVLGLMSLRVGKVPEAIGYLHAAGKSPGSPQLNSFGPSMHLAKALATKGEFDAVAKYLDDIRYFWKMEDGAIDRWKADLAAKRVPDFGSNMRPI